jgi:hypothetical protein
MWQGRKKKGVKTGLKKQLEKLRRIEIMKLHQFKITCTRCGADVTFKKCRCDDKRKPLPDGTLELKDEELSEFIHLFYPNTKTLKISASGCFILSNAERNIINNYKAILWLAERFDLTEK